MTNEELFENQKKLLDTFLSTGAITQAQHDYSLSCLESKMKIGKEETDKEKTEEEGKDD